MKSNNYDELIQLLGKDFSENEIKELQQKDSKLAINSPALIKQFKSARKVQAPELSANFTAQVIEKIEKHPAKLQPISFFKSWKFPAWSVAVFSLAIIALTLLPGVMQKTVEPGFKIVKVTTNTEGQKVFKVRFALQEKNAEFIYLLGDFTQWQTVSLDRAKNNTYYIELDLPSGTYSYGFLVNGSKWVVDASAHQMVRDGFGSQNALINL